MEALLTVALGSGNVYTVRAFGFLEYSAVDPGFHIDEVSFTTGRRTVSTVSPLCAPSSSLEGVMKLKFVPFCSS